MLRLPCTAFSLAACSRATSSSRFSDRISSVTILMSFSLFSAAFAASRSFCAFNFAVFAGSNFTATSALPPHALVPPPASSSHDPSARDTCPWRVRVTGAALSSAATLRAPVSPPSPALRASHNCPASCSAFSSSPSQNSSSMGATKPTRSARLSSTLSSTTPPEMYSTSPSSSPGNREQHTAAGSTRAMGPIQGCKARD
mmetsp:Transcript_24478/g.33743  ORF Transcript_24478/g.33743 Transcript_24478/m.33743 type:complete len:200 (-) Transcript_24478:90-689(-)